LYTSIDKIDYIILKNLLVDGRTSYSALAKETDLTDVAIKKRVDSLKRRGIINAITVDINYDVLGFEKPLFIQMRIELSKTKDVIKKLESFDYVMELYHVLGEYNLLAKVILPNREIIERFIKDLSSIDGVIDIKSLFVLNKLKSSTSLPANVLQKRLK
jgi:DNA-binding Lrp family transcriptional regulator